MKVSNAILLISCPDQKGITAFVTNFVYKYNGNIVHADQHIDDQSNTFFMRLEWELKGFTINKEKISDEFQSIACQFSMDWNLSFSDKLQKIVLFVSRHMHCLDDLMLRYKAGHLPCEISLIISNHSDARKQADEAGIKFYEIPINPANKEGQEHKEIEILKGENIDLIVLARYHQIFTENFVKTFKNQIINIHHSFLPAFVGKSPYAQAYQKGVKIIGATSHYVTEELDQGPIIEQDIVRISHRDSLDDLIRKGEDLEKVVLSRALRWALQKKILCYGNKTVIFD